MSYYAQAKDAVIRVTKDYPLKLLNELEEYTEDVVNITLNLENPDYNEYTFDYKYGRFDGDGFMEVLKTLNTVPGILYGNITFSAEGGAYGSHVFRYIYEAVENCWKDEEAFLAFPSEMKHPSTLTHAQRMELLGVLADIVEDYMEAKDFQIDHPELDENGEENSAILVGADYDHLTSQFEGALINFGLLPKEAEKEEP